MKTYLLSAGPTPPVRYLAALSAVGARGIPWTPHTDPTPFDGLLLCGGGDPEPALFGQENKGSYAIDRRRDQRELGLLHRFLQMKKPVLAICRGHQLLNVAFGGSLVQHLPTAHLHMGAGEDLWHPVEATDLLCRLYGPRFTVNSCHHQGLDRLGRGLLPIAHAPDGVVEGVTHRTLPVLGVQFHPERMEQGTPLFDHFVHL